MSQMVTRQADVTKDKEKRQTDSPVKEMKKKMAANAEKEKQTEKSEKTVEKVTEKTDKAEKSEKVTEKPADKPEKAEKSDKNATDKKTEKSDKSADKKTEKTDKNEKKADKSEPQAEKSREDKNAKADKPDPKKSDKDSHKKQNGREHNGDVTADDVNGTVSADSDDEMLVIDDHDEMFPELAYDDSSDVEFEPPTPDAPGRSLTRRSQPKDSKVLKLKDDAPPTDRKLRSADSPKPESKKEKKDKESPKKAHDKEEKEDSKSEEKNGDGKSQDGDKDVEIIEIDANEGEEARKAATNYSKSRVKVSPYRRSTRLADHTDCSLVANYTGNNTTMEMDITESSFADSSALDDSSYLRGLRAIRGRSSYKPLKEITLTRHTSTRSVNTTNASQTSSTPLLDSQSRPTGTVVGRKRRPDAEPPAEPDVSAAQSKRMRVLERLAEPFRRVRAAAALPVVARRNADIVGINTDLPLSAPVSADSFDPESLKPSLAEPLAVPLPTPSPTPTPTHDDNKRCSIM